MDNSYMERQRAYAPSANPFFIKVIISRNSCKARPWICCITMYVQYFNWNWSLGNDSTYSEYDSAASKVIIYIASEATNARYHFCSWRAINSCSSARNPITSSNIVAFINEKVSFSASFIISLNSSWISKDSKWSKIFLASSSVSALLISSSKVDFMVFEKSSARLSVRDIIIFLSLFPSLDIWFNS